MTETAKYLQPEQAVESIRDARAKWPADQVIVFKDQSELRPDTDISYYEVYAFIFCNQRMYLLVPRYGSYQDEMASTDFSPSQLKIDPDRLWRYTDFLTNHLLATRTPI